METNEIKTLENLRKVTAQYFNTLSPTNNNTGDHIAQIKFVNYYELGCTFTSILKLCILALDHEAHKIIMRLLM
jgi:hypothetical protein